VVRDPCAVIRDNRAASANGGGILRWDVCRSEFQFGDGLVGGLPPVFFVSVASKGVRFPVSPLDATLAGWFVSVAFKWVRVGMVCGYLGVHGEK
jgi:hypothetical protein